MAEWLRAASLDPEDEVAARALRTLAEQHDGWDRVLVHLAWRLALIFSYSTSTSAVSVCARVLPLIDAAAA